jgi:hypothetical protein
VSTAREVYEVLTYRGWQELFPLLSTVHEICIGQLPPTSIVEYSEHTPNLSLIGGPTPFYRAWYYSLDYCYNSQYQALDRSAWRLAINVPEPWLLCLLGFISRLPQLAWDKRLCCCCCCTCYKQSKLEYTEYLNLFFTYNYGFRHVTSLSAWFVSPCFCIQLVQSWLPINLTYKPVNGNQYYSLYSWNTWYDL